MDAAKWVLHLRLTRQRASNAAAHALVLRLSFCLFVCFFFFLKWIRADSASIHADSRQIGLFGQNQIVPAESNCIGWQSKLTKMAEIGLESCRNS